MTYFTRPNNNTMNAVAAANGATGHVRPGMGLDLNSFASIKDNGPGIFRRVFIRI